LDAGCGKREARSKAAGTVPAVFFSLNHRGTEAQRLRLETSPPRCALVLSARRRGDDFRAACGNLR